MITTERKFGAPIGKNETYAVGERVVETVIEEDRCIVYCNDPEKFILVHDLKSTEENVFTSLWKIVSSDEAEKAEPILMDIRAIESEDPNFEKYRAFIQQHGGQPQ